VEYVAPEFQQAAFNCPHCNAYAHMNWQSLLSGNARMSVCAAFCGKCYTPSLWVVAGTNGRATEAHLPSPNPAIQIYPAQSDGFRSADAAHRARRRYAGLGIKGYFKARREGAHACRSRLVATWLALPSRPSGAPPIVRI
jgi:hypothetical protein